ncbi:MAG: ATP-binding protein [Clostridiales Family XIII bacterium]|jgi:hypothetical protein|nr:ATP-binding protein [Clostridiales Family XIII bacterium]
MEDNIFLPAFGVRPQRIVGRNEIVADYLDGLKRPPGHPVRATFYKGQRGMGKTALLIEIAAKAISYNFVVARVTASEQMTDEIIQTIQINGEQYIPSKKNMKSVSAGALGFSFGLTFSDETEQKYGFRIKLSMLLDELKKYGKGILILVDEVQQTNAAMRELATTYQHLIGEGKNIAIAMAGLPSAVSSILNDDILTFLNRANKVELGPIALSDVSLYYSDVFSKAEKKIAVGLLDKAVAATKGYPYLLQLIGYYIIEYTGEKRTITGEIVEESIRMSMSRLVENVHLTSLKVLSDKDIEFLRAMSEDSAESNIADVMERLRISNSYAQQYRQRLIDAGVIVAERRGSISLAVPYLGEYLRGELV